MTDSGVQEHFERADSAACRILITCGEPSLDGKMHVEMTYDGDADLAALMIEKARQHFQQ
jgi:hypothetical protein